MGGGFFPQFRAALIGTYTFSLCAQQVLKPAEGETAENIAAERTELEVYVPPLAQLRDNARITNW